jgi:DNA-binding transcriptional ArsR family regulator
MKCPSYNLFFSTISHPLRMKIVQALQVKPMSVTELKASLKEEQSKISHNLQKLRQCHIVESARKGKQMIYSLNKETVAPLLQLVEAHVKKYCKEVCHNLK